MRRLLTLAALLALAGCAQETPVDVECSVDDTLVFVAPSVSVWDVRSGGVLMTYSREDGNLYRRMQENETCRAVSK